jgi:hypothetical protein
LLNSEAISSLSDSINVSSNSIEFDICYFFFVFF